MSIIALLWIYAISSFVYKRAGKRKRKPAQARRHNESCTQIITVKQLQAQVKAQETERRRQAQEQARILREQEKARAQATKAAAQAEKARQRKQQAQADVSFLIHQQEQICELLSINDRDIDTLNQSIEIDRLTRSYDSEIRDSRKKESLLKKQMALEAKLHTIEKKIAAAQYTIDGAA